MTKELDDKQLVSCARSGDSDAFVELMDRYRPLVFGICMRLADNSSDAHELAHDAFVEAYLHLDQLREAERFAGWLRTLTLNHCRAYLRRHRQEVELPEDLIDPRTEAAEIEEDEAALLARMSWGLAELRPQQRLVLVLHYFEHLSYEEISRFFEVPIGTVMSRLHRARQALREMIQNMDMNQETSMIEEDKFKQEVLAEIAVLLRMFPGERSAQERLAVVLENSPKRLGDFLRNTDDGETLGNLALLLPHLGQGAFDCLLDICFSGDDTEADRAAEVLQGYAGNCQSFGWRAWSVIQNPHGMHVLLDRLIASPAGDEAKAKLVYEFMRTSEDEPTQILLSCLLMCYEDAAFPLLMEEFRASATTQDLYSRKYLLPSLVRTGGRFCDALLEMLQSGDSREQAFALVGLETLSRMVGCDWLQDATDEKLMDWLRTRPPYSPAGFHRRYGTRDKIDLHLRRSLTMKTAELLKSSESEIRNMAIRILGNLKDNEHLEELKQCVSHAEGSTRLTALQALADINDHSAIGVFLTVAENGGAPERRTATEILGRWKVTESTALLIRLVEDPDASVRRAAVTALREIGGEEADAVIASLVRSPDKKIRKKAGEIISGRLMRPQKGQSELTEQRLLKIRPNVVLDAYISTDAAMRFALPEIRPYGETELTSRIAAVCCDYSATRRKLIELGLCTRTHMPTGGCVYEFTELGKAVWRVERFIVERYLRRMV